MGDSVLSFTVGNLALSVLDLLLKSCHFYINILLLVLFLQLCSSLQFQLHIHLLDGFTEKFCRQVRSLLVCSFIFPHNLNYFNHLFLNLVTYSPSFTDKTEKRYNPNMSPAIRKDKWRKGSQVIIGSGFYCHRYFNTF
jgi:hypothetical protein